MRKPFLALAALALLASCSPPEEDYCAGFGVNPGHGEYAKCTSYYFQQQAAFGADRAVCDSQADLTYPPTLYDNGGWAHVRGHYYGGRFYGGESVRIPPDYQKNAQVDALRMRIIQPCMQSRGWNSGATWQAGRHAGPAPAPIFTPVPPVVAPSNLPWIAK